MKIVTTISENTSVNVQRFENDMKVGERNLRLVDYCYSLMKGLPIGALFEHLVSEEEDVKEYFKNLEDFAGFDEFFSLLLKNVPGKWYEENPEFLNFLSIAMGKLSSIEPTDPNVSQFLLTISRNSGDLPMDSNMVSLLLHFFERLLSTKQEDSSNKVIRNIFVRLIKLLDSEQNEELKNTITHLIPNLDEKWFGEMVMKVQKESTVKVSYFGGQIPEGVSYMGVTSHGTSFVYKVPKGRIRLKYKGVVMEDVGHPNLLAIYRLNSNDKISSMKLVAVKDTGKLKEDTEVFEYPYSHVYSTGSVCWSAYHEFTSEQLPHVANMFLSTDNSGHLRENCYDLYKENEGKDFDDSKLSPFGLLRDLL